MLFLALLAWFVAFLLKGLSAKATRIWVNASLAWYSLSLVGSIVQLAVQSDRYVFNQNGFLGSIAGLAILIMVRVRLEHTLAKYQKKLHDKAQRRRDKDQNRRMPHIDSNNVIDYAKLANKIFDISLELSGLAKDDLVKNGAFYLDPSTIQTSSMYGTGLYEYSMLLLRERMRKIYTDKHTFEAEDNKMVEVFANKLMVPSTALLKIIDRNGGVKSWEKMLLQDDSVPMDEYINEVKVEVNRATRDLIMSKTDTGLVKTGDPVVSKPKDDTPEDDFDDGL